MENVVLIIFGAVIIYWLYAHIQFWIVLRTEASKEFKSNSDFSLIKYVNGFQWIDYALKKEYIKLNNEALSKAGDRLCNIYLFKTAISGYIMSFVVLGFIIYLAWYFIQNAT